MAKVIVFDCFESWRVTTRAGKASPHKSSGINVRCGRVRSSWMMLLGQQVCWDLRHRVGSGSLSSLSSLNKDGHNLLLCFSLSPHLPPPSPACIIHHPCLFLSFCLPESTSISVLSLFPLSTSSPHLWSDYSWGGCCWVTPRVALGIVGQGCSQQQGVEGRSGRDGGRRVGSKASLSDHPFNRGAWFLFCHPRRSTSQRLMCPVTSWGACCYRVRDA